MRKALLYSSCCMGVLTFFSCGGPKQAIPAVAEDINTEWKFHAGDGVDSGWYRIAYEDNHWKQVLSTQTLAAQHVHPENGFGWYRKQVVFSKAMQTAIRKSGGVVLDLGKFAACEEVYVNGNLVGKTGDFPPDFAGYFDHERRYYVAADDLNSKGENLIAIKFHDGWSTAGGFLNGSKIQILPAGILDQLSLDVKVKDEDYIFLGKDSIAIEPQIKNRGQELIRGQLIVKLQTDDYQFLKEERINITIPAKGSFSGHLFGLKLPQPGFYRYDISFALDGNRQIHKKFNVGYEPEKIVSPNDQPADFDIFWSNNLSELAKVDPGFQLTLLPEQSKLDYNMYEVSMRSLENEIIRGYYAKPKKEGKHPVIVEYMGYGSSPYFPNHTWDGFAYFVLSIRGQALNKPTNRFGTWFTYGIENKETYYYRGAYMDVVRALDFVSSRTEIDAERIAVRGSSQGGALSVVAAALDRRVKALAIGIPFLSDFKDYFQIASWPKSDVDAYLQQHPGVTAVQVYNTLSYFDIKNLASRITVPMVMGIGVQDEVCPPHTNFAVYNQVASPKSWMAFGTYGHSTGNEFHQAGLTLFRKQLQAAQP